MKPIELLVITKTDPNLRLEMLSHYSQPKGFVGRLICYAVYVDGIRYGSCIAGSSVYYLAARDNYFRIVDVATLRTIVNNIFYHVGKVGGHYPQRNFTSAVLAQFRSQVASDWVKKYGDQVIGFESLVELPRTGECYRRDGWEEIGTTKGYTCKRVAEGNELSSDSWTGRRVWDTVNLRPKRIFVKRVE